MIIRFPLKSSLTFKFTFLTYLLTYLCLIIGLIYVYMRLFTKTRVKCGRFKYSFFGMMRSKVSGNPMWYELVFICTVIIQLIQHHYLVIGRYLVDIVLFHDYPAYSTTFYIRTYAISEVWTFQMHIHSSSDLQLPSS